MKINKNAIESIKVVGFKEESDYKEYKVFKKRNFWGKHIGWNRLFKSIFSDEYSITSSTAKNYFGIELFIGKDGFLYHYPYVEITLFSGQKRILNFKSIKECENKVKEIEELSENTFIEL